MPFSALMMRRPAGSKINAYSRSPAGRACSLPMRDRRNARAKSSSSSTTVAAFPVNAATSDSASADTLSCGSLKP